MHVRDSRQRPWRPYYCPSSLAGHSPSYGCPGNLNAQLHSCAYNEIVVPVARQSSRRGEPNSWLHKHSFAGESLAGWIIALQINAGTMGHHRRHAVESSAQTADFLSFQFRALCSRLPTFLQFIDSHVRLLRKRVSDIACSSW
jgi:hypothetical protein